MIAPSFARGLHGHLHGGQPQSGQVSAQCLCNDPWCLGVMSARAGQHHERAPRLHSRQVPQRRHGQAGRVGVGEYGHHVPFSKQVRGCNDPHQGAFVPVGTRSTG